MKKSTSVLYNIDLNFDYRVSGIQNMEVGGWPISHFFKFLVPSEKDMLG